MDVLVFIGWLLIAALLLASAVGNLARTRVGYRVCRRQGRPRGRGGHLPERPAIGASLMLLALVAPSAATRG
jgi:hypothetical protein